MGSIVKFSAVNSKVKALKGKMLNKEQYLKLQQSKNFKDAVNVLKEETYYGIILSDYNLDTLHREDLEIVLDRYYINIYSKFLNYFSGEYRKVIKNLFLRWEIEDLKIIIRGKYLKKSRDEIENRLIAKSNLNTINYDYLLPLKDAEEILEALKETIYYKPLKNLVKDIDKKGLFRLETELDFLYFSSIRKEIKHLDKENKEAVYSIIGIEADLLNLNWIYRGKFFYKIPPEELFNYTIYDSFKLSKDTIKNLCYVNSNEEFQKLLKDSKYSFIYQNDNLSFIEKREREFEREYFSRIIKENKNNLSVVMSYFILYGIEIKDIISILEQKRYIIDMSKSIV
jgi:V/A-type H+-transporting ATPase subunit C